MVAETITTRLLVRRIVAVAAIALAGLALVAALPGLGELRARLGGARPGWVLAALVLEAASVGSFVVAFRGTYSRRLPWRLSAQVGLAEQGANVLLPTGGAGGLALGAWALGRAGLPAELVARRTVAFFLVTSAANFATAVLAGAGVLSGVLPGAAPLLLTAGPAALALATVAIVLLLLPRVLPAPGAEAPGAGRARALLVRGGATLAAGVRDAVALVREGRPALLAGSAGYMAFDLAALAAAFHAFGHAPAAGDLLLAYVIGQLGGLVPLPGGLGGTDGGLVAALALYGTPLAAAIAAVLAYRAFQLGLPAVSGTVAFASLQRSLRRPAAPAGCRAAGSGGACAEGRRRPAGRARSGSPA